MTTKRRKNLAAYTYVYVAKLFSILQNLLVSRKLCSESIISFYVLQIITTLLAVISAHTLTFYIRMCWAPNDCTFLLEIESQDSLQTMLTFNF